MARSSSPLRRRFTVFACAVFAFVHLLPQGFMPVRAADGTGWTLAFCLPSGAEAPEGWDFPKPAETDHQSDSSACVFASALSTALPQTATVPAVFAAPTTRLREPVRTAKVHGGTAAPPLPARGPPRAA